MRAAVLRTIGDTVLEAAEIDLAPIGPDQVRIRLHRAGLCHSDLSAMCGVIAHPAPFVPGHEGAGEIVEVGTEVSGHSVGDRVVVCWMPPCGSCAVCRAGNSNLCRSGLANLARPAFREGGGPLPGMLGTGTFAEEVVLSANAALPIPDDLPYDVAALIGCGVTTGIGAALNTAKVEPGSSVVVIGLGGVGMSIVQGARVAGAARIVAVDPTAGRRDLALDFGATDAVAPEELPDVLKSSTGGAGFDYAFEAVGKPGTFRAAYDAARQGGSVVLVGVGARTDLPDVSMSELVLNEKRILPSFYGGADVRRTMTVIIDLWRAGRLDLEALITHHVPLADVNKAIRQMHSGEALRTVVDIAAP